MQRLTLLRLAGEVIRDGGVVAYPTEAVYGLGCDPGNPRAVQRIKTLKHRPPGMGLILIAAEPEQLAGWIDPSAAELKALLTPTSKPTTWIITAGPLAGRWLTGARTTLAVRITEHALAADLCRNAGMPLVSTSANRRGRPPARSALSVRCRFGAGIDLLVPGETGPALRPSEIRVAATGHCLRAG